MDNKERILQLEKEIKEHFDRYLIGMEVISDYEYDKLVDELKELHPKSEILKQITYTKTFDPNIQEEDKVELPTSMGTLNKIYDKDLDLVKEMLKTGPLSLSPKFDGMAIQLKYVEGELIGAYSRGNGVIGQNVSKAIAFVPSIPKNIKDKNDIIVVGELVCTKDKFKILEKQGYSLIRAVVPGVVCSKSKINLSENFTFFGFEIRLQDNNPNTRFDRLTDLGFLNIKKMIKTVTTFEEFNEYKKFIHDNRDNLPFPIDGLVIEDIQSGNRIAYKFENKLFYAKIERIFYKTGKTGMIMPCIELYSGTKFEGKEMKYVSGGSMDTILKNGIVPDCTVELELTGDVGIFIKRVIKYDNPDKSLEVPKNCPDCGSLIVKKGANIFCSNPKECPGIIKGLLAHHIKVIEIKDLGYERICKMYDEGHVKSILEIYTCPMDRWQTIGENMGIKMYNTIRELKATKISISTFLASLGINNFGKTSAEKLAVKYKRIERILDCTKDEIGEFVAGAYLDDIYNEFEYNRNMYVQLLNYLTVEEIKEYDGKLKGKSFCITGSLSITKDKAYDIIRKNGGKVENGVKKDLSFLVCNGISSSGKYKKATEYGIPIISEKELLTMMN